MAEEEEPPTQSKLTELTNAANLQYSLKHYPEAAELYSRATEMQTALLGDEMAPENAELLYLYGRCLFKVAVSKSDVLGGQVAAEKKPATNTKKAAAAPAVESPGQKLAEDVVEAVVEEKNGGPKKEDAKDGGQPFFQLVDAEWSDDEGSDGSGDAEGDVQEALEEEDDFATAYEILDVARVLLERQVAANDDDPTAKGKGKGTEMTQHMCQLKDRLADTHDLQAEISLENERFDEAIDDFAAAAALKDELHPRGSSIVAEAHYKLSLALEFESMSAVRAAQAKEEAGGGQKGTAEKVEVNEELRERARKETEIAVESIKLRIEEEEGKLEKLEGKEKEGKKRDVEDVKEILKEMEDRLTELHAPAVTMSAPTAATADDPMSGIIAQVLGETPEQSRKRIEEATKNANDLSGLIKKKKPKAAAAPAADGGASATNGKRKADELEVNGGDGKRAKTEELGDAA